MGRRRRRRRRRGSACSTCAPHRAARRRRWRPTARSWSPPTSDPNRARARPGQRRSASTCELPVRRRRRTAAAVRVRARSTPCCSTRRAPGSARCAVVPTPAGGSSRPTSRELAVLQRRLLAAAAELVRPGGRLIYSVCTLTAAESIDHPTPDGFEVDDAPPPVGTWRPFGHGWRVLPARRRHRRHGADSVPSRGMSDADDRRCTRAAAKVLTVSDGVVHGTRDDASGRGAGRTSRRRRLRRRRAPRHRRRRRPRRGRR